MSCLVDIIKVIKGDPVYESYRWGPEVYDEDVCDYKVEAYDTTGKTGIAQVFNKDGQLVTDTPLSFNFVDVDTDNIILAFTITQIESLDLGDYDIILKIDDSNKPIYMPDEGKIVLNVIELEEVSA